MLIVERRSASLDRSVNIPYIQGALNHNKTRCWTEEMTKSSIGAESSTNWPDNKSFAFTIFDDTDLAKLDSIRPVYAQLADFGFHTTKSVWPLPGNRQHPTEGVTCDDTDYVDWLKELRRRGFEIGYHMATWHTSPREVTEKALNRFEQIFGTPPRTMANHASCEENLYWGTARLSGIRTLLYNALTLGRQRNRFRGHIESDPLFWGDLCRDRIEYVRGFVFPDINTLKVCPYMPYHDPLRPYVRYWFASSEGANIRSFIRLLSEANQDRLEAEGGACIVYTHLGAGFCENGKLNPRFAALMKRLGKKNGYFVPVEQLLDFLKTSRGEHRLTNRERARLEWQWLRFKLRKGTS